MGVWPCISSFYVFYGTALEVRHQGLNPSSNPFPESLDPTPAARSRQALHITADYCITSVAAMPATTALRARAAAAAAAAPVHAATVA